MQLCRNPVLFHRPPQHRSDLLVVFLAACTDVHQDSGLFRWCVCRYSTILHMPDPIFRADIGGILYGNGMRVTILTSIAVSQIGFVAGD